MIDGFWLFLIVWVMCHYGCEAYALYLDKQEMGD